jgi:hypothetical protein
VSIPVIFTDRECDTLDEAFSHLDKLRHMLVTRDAIREACRVDEAISMLLDTARGRDLSLVTK